jgi:hypothetical protein
MGTVLTGPKAKAIVVFGSNNHSGCTCIFGYSAPLVGIKLIGLKNLCFFIAMPPFFTAKRIGAKMEEKVKFIFMPGKLIGRRLRQLRMHGHLYCEQAKNNA